ncbi:hypothetical protein [Oryzibacter oryziterrae]|uniref:hypothetical protein n=1 Tax=Oryzibacter oryziterrae TaxID=2766474 RepID=UPI001F444406|nr:hypothetical protein [Oryzibacter oryziterrae]
MKILVGIPAYRQAVSTICLQSLVNLFTTFGKTYDHISLDLKIAQATVVHRARNAFASLVYRDPSYTHLLLVDPDIGFRPSLIERMLDFNEPVVGATYPVSALDRNSFMAFAKEMETGADAEVCALEYAGGGASVVTVDSDAGDGSKDLVLRDAFLRVNEVGNDLLLIRRDAFERMAEDLPTIVLPDSADPYRQFGLTGPVIQCFDPLPLSGEGLFSDQNGFSRRWADSCGGELWACFVEPMQRRVEDTVAGHFLTKLQHGQI